MTSTQDLVEHLKLKPIDTTTFEGYSVPVGSPNVFGGQVLAQAIAAAYNTITNNRILNSMHSYFLEAGENSMVRCCRNLLKSFLKKIGLLT